MEILGNNDAVTEAHLIEKYRDLVFFNTGDDFMYMAYDKKLVWINPQQKNGLGVLGIPSNLYRETEDDLES